MKTLSAIVNSYADSLLVRAADVVMLYFSAWLILAGSKFVILAVGDFFLGSTMVWI